MSEETSLCSESGSNPAASKLGFGSTRAPIPTTAPARKLSEDSIGCISEISNLFRDPKQLSCGHSFCRDCLCGTQSLYSVTCAICRKATYLNSPGLQGVQFLPTNYAVTDAVSAVQEGGLTTTDASDNLSVGSVDSTESAESAGISERNRSYASLEASIQLKLSDKHGLCADCTIENHHAHQCRRVTATWKLWHTLCVEFDRLKSTTLPALSPHMGQYHTALTEIQDLWKKYEALVTDVEETEEKMKDLVKEGDTLRWQKPSPKLLQQFTLVAGPANEAAKVCEKEMPIINEHLTALSGALRDTVGALDEVAWNGKLERTLNDLTAPSIPTAIAVSFPDAKTVSVAGSFTGWKPTIRLVKHREEFIGTVELSRGTHEFKFLLNDSEWVYADTYDTCPDAHGGLNNSLIV